MCLLLLLLLQMWVLRLIRYRTCVPRERFDEFVVRDRAVAIDVAIANTVVMAAVVTGAAVLAAAVLVGAVGVTS